MSRRSLMTPKNRKSMLGFTSATSRLRGEIKATPLEQRKLTFSSSRKVIGKNLPSGSKRWSNQGAHSLKDTRPLTNKSYQRLMIDDIIEFLNDSGYPHLITVKILSAPTTKEFLRVFEHLYNFILPNFSLEQKKYAEEIPILMKSIKFPFTISKSTMFGVGSMHAWPTLLGVLHWLIKVIQTTSSIDIEQVLFPPALQEDLNNIHKKLFFEHTSRTYVEFMLGQEDFTEENKLLEFAAMRLSSCCEEDNKQLEFEVYELESELVELENEPDILVEALKQQAEFQDLIDQAQQKRNELDQEHTNLLQQHVQAFAQVKEEGFNCAQLGDSTRQDELKRKSSGIELQINRLNAEKERLEELNDEREVTFSRLYNKFSAVATKYNDIAVKLTTNPIIHQYIGEECIMLKFDHSQNNLNDFKLRLKPLLIKVSHQISDDRCKLEAHKIKMEVESDKMKETLSTKKNVELVRLKDQLERIQKELGHDIEIAEKEYLSALEELKKKEQVLDEKQKEVTEILEEGKLQLAKRRKECDEIHKKQLQVQDTELSSLLKFEQKVVEHIKMVEDQIDLFNSYLEIEINNMVEEGKNMAKLCEY